MYPDPFYHTHTKYSPLTYLRKMETMWQTMLPEMSFLHIRLT